MSMRLASQSEVNILRKARAIIEQQISAPVDKTDSIETRSLWLLVYKIWHLLYTSVALTIAPIMNADQAIKIKVLRDHATVFP